LIRCILITAFAFLFYALIDRKIGLTNFNIHYSTFDIHDLV